MYDYLHDENLFEMNMALRCEVKNLKRIVEEYQSGKRYLKIQEDHNRVTNSVRDGDEILRKRETLRFFGRCLSFVIMKNRLRGKVSKPVSGLT